MSEAKLFLHAVRFLTVIPVPSVAEIEPNWLARSAKYFPLVGILVGAVAGGTLLLADRIWPGVLAAIVAVSVGIIITGALHEDGLADTTDALGGRSREARLAIMKDSRLGTYGALALGICLALKITVLSALPVKLAAAALIAAHGVGRLSAAGMMALLPYGGEPHAAKISYAPDGIRAGELAVAAMFGILAIIPAAFIAPYPTALGTMTGFVIVFGVAHAAKALLGGYTGDVLGTGEQLFEAAFLLGIAAAISAQPMN